MKMLLSSGLLLLTLTGCRREAPPPPATPAPRPHQTLPALPPGEASIYDLTVPLVDHAGRPLRLDQFHGGPVLISMFYTTCPNACPLLISDLKRIERALSDGARGRLHLLMVSFDPQNDSVDKLRQIVGQHKLDGERWRLARTPEERVLELGAVLGIKYRNLNDGSFNHSSVITLLDGEGRIVNRLEGLNQPAAAMVGQIEALAKVVIPETAK